MNESERDDVVSWLIAAVFGFSGSGVFFLLVAGPELIEPGAGGRAALGARMFGIIGMAALIAAIAALARPARGGDPL